MTPEERGRHLYGIPRLRLAATLALPARTARIIRFVDLVDSLPPLLRSAHRKREFAAGNGRRLLLSRWARPRRLSSVGDLFSSLPFPIAGAWAPEFSAVDARSKHLAPGLLPLAAAFFELACCGVFRTPGFASFAMAAVELQASWCVSLEREKNSTAPLPAGKREIIKVFYFVLGRLVGIERFKWF